MAVYQFQEQLSANLVTPASTFQTSYEPIPSTILLFVNGVYQRINADFTVSSDIITTASLIPTTYDVRVAYSWDDTQITVETPTSTMSETLFDNATAATSLFTMSREPITGSLMVFVNGVQQRNYVDYNSSGDIVAFTSVIPLGYIVSVTYDYYTVPPTILPEGVQGSTTLNPIVTSYVRLSERIKMQLGWPVIEIEICDDQIYEFINIAMEWFTKYAGYTEEYLVFSSDLYREPGLRMDLLFSISPRVRSTLQTGGSAIWDYDLEDYRKVISVWSFQQGESTGVNTLFTLEHAMQQQTYFSYMLGNVGFDLITWHVLKDWLKLREKVLAQVTYVDFDNRTQLLRLVPPPTTRQRYLGAIGCWVERPIRDVIRERWVYQYALALTKISIGNIRGKYGSVQMFGGGTISYQDLLSQGLREKEALEKQLLEESPDSDPPRFYLG